MNNIGYVTLSVEDVVSGCRDYLVSVALRKADAKHRHVQYVFNNLQPNWFECVILRRKRIETTEDAIKVIEADYWGLWFQYYTDVLMVHDNETNVRKLLKIALLMLRTPNVSVMTVSVETANIISNHIGDNNDIDASEKEIAETGNTN